MCSEYALSNGIPEDLAILGGPAPYTPAKFTVLDNDLLTPIALYFIISSEDTSSLLSNLLATDLKKSTSSNVINFAKTPTPKCGSYPGLDISVT